MDIPHSVIGQRESLCISVRAGEGKLTDDGKGPWQLLQIDMRLRLDRGLVPSNSLGWGTGGTLSKIYDIRSRCCWPN